MFSWGAMFVEDNNDLKRIRHSEQLNRHPWKRFRTRALSYHDIKYNAVSTADHLGFVC